MLQPPVPPRVFVDADVLATRTPLCWLAMLRDETGAFRLVTSPDALAAATSQWRAHHPDAATADAARREELLRGVLDDVTTDGATQALAPDEVLCRIDDEAAGSVRALTRRRQRELGARHAAGIRSTSLTDALAAAGCPAFAERVAAHLRAIAA